MNLSDHWTRYILFGPTLAEFELIVCWKTLQILNIYYYIDKFCCSVFGEDSTKYEGPDISEKSRRSSIPFVIQDRR